MARRSCRDRRDSRRGGRRGARRQRRPRARWRTGTGGRRSWKEPFHQERNLGAPASTRRANRITAAAQSSCTVPLPWCATKTSASQAARQPRAASNVRFMERSVRGVVLTAPSPRVFYHGSGTESSIIEPTGSIVDPDTVTNVRPPRGEDRRYGEGPVILFGLQ